MFFLQFGFFIKRKLQATEDNDGKMPPFIKLLWFLVLMAGLMNLEQTLSSFIYPLLMVTIFDKAEEDSVQQTKYL